MLCDCVLNAASVPTRSQCRTSHTRPRHLHCRLFRPSVCGWCHKRWCCQPCWSENTPDRKTSSPSSQYRPHVWP